MNPPLTTPRPEFSPSLLTSLEQCSDESVYAPGYIQPNGVLLVLQEPHLIIRQASETVEQFFGIPAAALVGQPLQQLLPRTSMKQIAECLDQNTLDLCNPLDLKVRVKDRSASVDARDRVRARGRVRTQTFKSSLYRVSQGLILELEPQPRFQKIGSVQFYHRLQGATLSLRGASSLSDLAQTLARAMKEVTGFDRVMVYRFEADEHGVVIAEEKESHLDSYLGLHYPAIDIPGPARNLFLRNWVRQIPDVNAPPARLIAIPEASLERPVDLSDCILRGVSPYHIEYLQNMGVAASLTISLISDQRLWGLISCHHYSPKLLNYEIRRTSEFLGQLASIELVHQQQRELETYRTQINALQETLRRELFQAPNAIQRVLTQNATELLHLVHAHGAAIAWDDQITLLGQTPALEEVTALLHWLPQLNQPEIYLTNCLIRPYPAAQAFTQVASGLLAVSIVLNQKSYHLLWFRPEQVQTVDWAGNPQDAIEIDEQGQMRLCPRKSFDLWKETVRNTSLPWESPEIEAARLMRNTLLLAVLEFSQAALEQAAERAAIANRAKSQFLAKMSHELRTPLNAILGFTQLMNRNPSTPYEFQEYLGIISRSGEHLLTLINDVLEMSRIEAGRVVLADIHFNLHQLLRSLQEMFTLKASEKGLMLLFEIGQTVPRYVCGDEAKLRQILINLISNAIKFTDRGRVTVRVRADTIQRVRPECGASATSSCYATRLAFAVEDTGCGIDEQDCESIFEAFMQTEQGRHAQGTGLGLSISRQFARLMGGDITVASTRHQGATFTCTVLLHQPESVNLAEPDVERVVVGLEPGQPIHRILVVEDVLENQKLLEALLKPIGFEVRIATNGVDAIAQWQAWQPHLILMDIQMPEMDGHETTRQIRLQERNRVNGDGADPVATPIIALTACAFEDDRMASLQAGCNDYMTKPFTDIALLEAIARQLGVQYRYADQSAPTVSLSASQPLTANDLKGMPEEWIAQVHESALDLNDTRLRHLIAQIPQHEPTLRKEMQYLINNFQLDAIAALTRVQGDGEW